MDFSKSVGRVLVLAFALSFLPVLSHSVTHDVTMGNGTFTPANLTISQGDIVRWTNSSILIHTTTSGTFGTPDGRWNSGDIGPSFSFSQQFNSAGTFPYFCSYHFLMGMAGSITVEQPTGIEDPGTPPSYELFQNHPNPFSPKTTIEYELASTSRVTIHIYNLKGQIVNVIEDAVRAPGRYPTVWDGRDAAGRRQSTGVYFYQMSVDGVGVEMRKMVLLR